MNKVLKLFDEQFVMDLFKKEVLPKYPNFRDIKKIKIEALKKHVWEKTYHVVIKFQTTFLTKEGKNKELDIYCSAHSDEPRKNVYEGLRYLWNNGFSQGYLTIPHPLFYSNYFKGVFYRGVEGENFYHYIREKKIVEIEPIIIKTAAWFAKLHSLPVKGAKNFNPENSRIATVIPSKEHTLAAIKRKYPYYCDIYKKAFDVFIKKEEEFLASTDKRWLIHGDAHPENIIKMSERKLGVIDFTDLCLADFARDLGCFLQQFEYMSNRKINDQKYVDKIKNLFLKKYLKNAKIELDDSLRGRIDNYYCWTALRTATFFLLRDRSEPTRAKILIDKIKVDLKI